MNKVIYLYLNDDDLSEIINLLNEKSIGIYAEDGTCPEQIDAISNGLRTFYIGNSSNRNIKFTPCFYTAKHLQPATFCLINEDDTFKEIKKYIVKNYRLSNDKSYYIGAGIYSDWSDKKLMLPVLFDYSSFSIDESEIDSLFDEILSAGYKIKTNNVRLRDVDVLDIKANSFVISTEKSELIISTIRKSIIRYEYGSDCIFVEKAKGKYIFYLDSRIEISPLSTVSELFHKIKK